MKMNQHDRRTRAQMNCQPYAGISPQLQKHFSWLFNGSFLLHSRACQQRSSVNVERHLPRSPPCAAGGSTGQSLPCRTPARGLPTNRVQLCPDKADLWISMYMRFFSPVPQELPWFSTAKLCKYLRLETGGGYRKQNCNSVLH